MSDDKAKKPRLGVNQRSILERVNSGLSLCVQYGRGKDKFYYADGSSIDLDSAERLMRGGYFTPNPDGLIPGMGQSLRLSQKGKQAVGKLS